MSHARNRWRSSIASLAIAVIVLEPPHVAAEEELDEIVVTADFRGRPAADVTSSISVLDGEQAGMLAVQHFEELVSVVPNFNWSGDGHRARYFQIRGVGELEQYEGAPNPSVGFLIDDIDFSGIGTIANLFDVEQIEVLRGPQGSRYGANALAGLVYVQTAQPTEYWDGRLQVGAANDSAYSVGAAVGGPLNADGSLAFRVSAHRHESDGFRDNPFLGRSDTNGRQELNLRARLRWQPRTDLEFHVTSLFADVDNGYDAFAVDNSLTVLSDDPGRDAQRSAGAAVKAIWTGHRLFEMTSITTAAHSDIDFDFDADWGNAESWAPFVYDFVSLSDRVRRTFSQELRIASTDEARLFADTTGWLFGLYVMELDEELATYNRGDYMDPFSGFEFSLDDDFSSRFEAVNAAAFGQLTIDVSDRGQLGFGLRMERRNTDYDDSAGTAVGPAETMIGGELGYSYTFDTGAMAYVELSRGYKAGGFNLGPTPDGRRKFDQEALWNLETGLKASWLDDSLSFSGSLFYSERADQQVRTSAQLNPNDPASFVFFTDNAAEGRTLGLEAEIRWLVAESWEFYATAGLLDAEFDSFLDPNGGQSGRDQAHAPNYTLAAGGAYRHASGLFARLDLAAKDAFYFDVSHDQRSASYHLANARLGYETERWTAQLWVRNLLDERYAVRGFYFGNEPPDFPNQLYLRYGDPRQAGVTFDVRF